MACIPSTPTTNVYLSDTSALYKSLGTISTSALSQYYPLETSPSVLTFSQVAKSTYQHLRIAQVQIRETASSSANIKKTALQVLLFTDAAPSAPSAGNVYNPSTTNMLGVVEIATADYKRWSDTVWVASVNTNLFVRTGTLATATNIYAVVLANETKTYAASAIVEVSLITECHNEVAI